MADVARPAATLSHHELCFGCGLANLFGLQLELEAVEGGGVAGRFFVKQDHQGSPGFAHGGVIGAALEEAMSLAVHARGVAARAASFEVHLHAHAPIGSFVRIEARIEKRRGKRLWTGASAVGAEEGAPLAEARGLFLADDPDDYGP
jgi:acyl-coenzyme A thioesterase PaaI-like protein